MAEVRIFRSSTVQILEDVLNRFEPFLSPRAPSEAIGNLGKYRETWQRLSCELVGQSLQGEGQILDVLFKALGRGRRLVSLPPRFLSRPRQPREQWRSKLSQKYGSREQSAT